MKQTAAILHGMLGKKRGARIASQSNVQLNDGNFCG